MRFWWLSLSDTLLQIQNLLVAITILTVAQQPFTFFQHQQGRIDFNTVNPSREGFPDPIPVLRLMMIECPYSTKTREVLGNLNGRGTSPLFCWIHSKDFTDTKLVVMTVHCTMIVLTWRGALIRTCWIWVTFTRLSLNNMYIVHFEKVQKVQSAPGISVLGVHYGRNYFLKTQKCHKLRSYRKNIKWRKAYPEGIF